MKEKITAFINNLILYDYILFGAALFLFLLFIIVGILLRRKIFFASIFIILAFASLSVGPVVGYIKLHEYLFKHTIVMTSQKKLHFTPAVIVKGKLTNESKKTFSKCKITAAAYKVTKNKYKNYLYKFKPFKEMSILEENIAVGETIDFKIIIEPFTYSKDYNISLKADCR
jgi:hypothetical protein